MKDLMLNNDLEAKTHINHQQEVILDLKSQLAIQTEEV